jgi:hypothetical protein
LCFWGLPREVVVVSEFLRKGVLDRLLQETIPITQNKKDGCVLKIFVMFVFVSVKVSAEMLCSAAWADE